MKHTSAKRRKREAEARPFREALIKQVGQCEHCGCSPGRGRKMAELSQLCVHEIARGPNRQKALDKPYAVLVLCWECNSGPFNGKGEWPESRQLALLGKKRPQDFDLGAYLRLTSPNAPRRIEIAEVTAWMDEDYLTKQDIAERMQVDRRSVQNWIEAGELVAMDARPVGSSRALYRVAWEDFLDFCQRRTAK